MNNNISIENINKGISAGYIFLNNNKTKITYHCARDYTTSFKNPEEKVRASYFVELILNYQYPNKQIDIEVTVPRRTPSDRADIVIFEDNLLKTPFLVVECKKDGITDTEFKQAIEQAFGNANSIRAKYATVIAGNTKSAFSVLAFDPMEREKNVIADIPVKFGKAPKYKYLKGDKERDIKIVSREELISTLEKCHTTVWQGGKIAPTIAFDEVSKLLFCKLKDEKEGTLKNKFYDFQVGTHESPKEVYNRINNIYQSAKKEDAEVFKDDIKLEARIVYNVVEHLQSLALSKIDLDTKGIAFERFMQDFFKGKMGQFFTPRAIVEFCIKIMNPEQSDYILDPACGSGGFLLNTLNYVRHFAEDNYEEREAWDYWHKFAQNNLFGIEINEQIARVAKMNMIIHDDGHTNVISTDALINFNEISKMHFDFQANKFDKIFTNPPFGAKIKNTEKKYLKDYKLGKKKKSQKSEVLFIERCIDFLKPETGTIGIVLPDSITINTSLQYVRDYIFTHTQILAIISLPDFAFSHFGANVKSTLLFLRKLGKNEKVENYPIFMANAEKIGYTATGKEEQENDLPIIERLYKKFIDKKETLQINNDLKEKIYIINSSEIEGNRIDVKAYAPKFKEIKQKIINSKKELIELRYCINKSISGDWGKDINEKNIDKKNFELCYVLRNTNFDNDYNLDYSKVPCRYIKKSKVKQIQLKQGDILIEKSGGSPKQPVGRVAIIEKLPFDKPVVYSNFLQKIEINENVINKKYVFAYLQSLYRLKYMEFIQNQTTGIKNLLLNDFLSIPIQKISEKEQEKIGSEYLENIKITKEIIETAYKKLNTEKDNYSKKMFA